MQKAAVQGYVGAAVDISDGVHVLLEAMDDINFLAFTPRGGAGITLPLAYHLSILGHAIVTIVTRGFPQDATDLHVAHARLENLRDSFSA
ncbi:unnamed protein product, partial [Laminaria digitata]